MSSPTFTDDGTAHASSTKKARLGLPLELELALKFLSVTEDLCCFAAVSKACRDAARNAYQTRIKRMPLHRSSSRDGAHQIKILSGSTVPECYKTPWWAVKQLRDEIWFRQACPVQFRDDGSWTLPQEHESYSSSPPKWLLEENHFLFTVPPNYLSLLKDDTELVHLSRVDNLVFVVLCRRTNRGNEQYNEQDTRKQLFGVLYAISSSVSSSSSRLLLTPTFCDKLTEPMDRNHYGSIDDIYFGNAVRSRNGKVLAVVTALPLGSDDNMDDEDPRETAVVSIFHVTSTTTTPAGVIAMSSIEVPMGDRTYESNLSMTISNGGEMLSIATSDDFGESCFWGVYTLMGEDDKPAEVLFKVEELGQSYSDDFWGHHFTPDNELWLRIKPGLDPHTFLEVDDMPNWLTQRIIVVQTPEGDDDQRFLLP